MKTIKSGDLTFYFGVEQGTQEWLDLRKGKVTCSNALTLLTRGKNFCLEANELAATRITPNGNGYAERGHVIENEARGALNCLLAPLGLKLETCTFITNDKYPNAGYSPDGLIVPLDMEDWWNHDMFIPLECKAYNDVTWDRKTKTEHHVDKHLKAVEDFDDVPLNARAQCQMEMMMVDAEKLCLLLANPDASDDKQMKLYWVNRDEQLTNRLKEKLS